MVSIRQLGEEDLARSGLTPEDAKELGIHFVTKTELAKLGHTNPEDAIVFPYWDPIAEEFLPLKMFHRARLLSDSRTGFAGQTKARRYSQPPGTLNSVYVPKTLPWADIFKDVKIPIFITEGEKKAASACKKGIPCMGLGGVDVFQAQKRGAQSLPIMDSVDWKARDTIVVFDTDTPDGLKPEVLRSAKRLLDWLLLRGARPSLLTLPYTNGAKVGLDDYLLTHSAMELESLRATNALSHGDATTVIEIASDYRYIIELDRFVGDDPHLLMQTQHLDRVLGMKKVTLPVLTSAKDPGGAPTTRLIPKPVAISEALLMWPGTEKFRAMVYYPGQPRHLVLQGRDYLNLWRGWKCEYVGTDRLPTAERREVIIAEWLWALDNVFAEDPAAREFVDHWLHYPLLVPGAKHNTFAMICSSHQGIGKSFPGHMLAKHLYGLTRPGARHAWQLTEGDLHGAFNPFMFATSFIEGDDIAAHDKKSVYERVKSFVTSDTVQINIKNTPQFMMDNRCNFWLTSNDAAPFFISETDRRAFVHTPRRAKKNMERYHALQLMFDAGEAGPTLLWYAREQYNAGAFSPMADAPLTEGKREIAQNSRVGAKEWVYDLVQHAELLTRPVATAREVTALMELDNVPGRHNPDAIGHHLRDAGALRWGNGHQFTIPQADGSQRRERVWILGGSLENAPDQNTVQTMLGHPFGYIKGNVVPLRKVSKY